ncbi:hypothetical protein MAR_032531, partial [Mya arenaria]
AKNEAVSVGTPVGVIAGGVSGGVVVIIGAVVAIFLLRRRSHRLPASNKVKRNAPTNERTYYNEGHIKRASTQSNSSSNQPPANKSIPIKQRAIAHVKTACESGIDLEMDDESDRVLANSSKRDQTYYKEAELSTNKSMIPVGQLVKYVDEKTNEAYSEEFETFSHGLVKPYVESQKRENVTKNRYKGIYP